MSSAASTLVGSEDSRLIIIRGNSGSGKSSLAKAIRAARPRGIAIVGQDVLRREVLHVRDHPETLSVPYMDLSRDSRLSMVCTWSSRAFCTPRSMARCSRVCSPIIAV